MTTSPTNDGSEPSYIDYEAFLSPSFSAAEFANSLVLATNNPCDTPLDLSTPLSRVLFDIQEIDSHIDALTTRSALPLLQHTRDQTAASKRIVSELDEKVGALNDSYKQLEKEVIVKHAEAEEVRRVAARLWETLRIGRDAGRCLQLGRQLEVQFAELTGSTASATSTTASKSGVAGASSAATSAATTAANKKPADPHALVRCAHTILLLREMLDPALAPPPPLPPLSASTSTVSSHGHHHRPASTSVTVSGTAHQLSRIAIVRTLQSAVTTPIERAVREAAEHWVRDFNVSGSSVTFAAAESQRERLREACVALWLLSPVPTASTSASGGKAGAVKDREKEKEAFVPTLMINALESYMRAALATSVAAIARGLATLPALDRALLETSLRCQNLVALEAVLESVRAPEHPLLHTSAKGNRSILPTSGASSTPATITSTSLLQPLLNHLETSSLPSWFWRTLASGLAPRAADIVQRGSAAARALRSNRQTVADAVRDCVVRGGQMPSSGSSVVGVGTGAGMNDGGGTRKGGASTPGSRRDVSAGGRGMESRDGGGGTAGGGSSKWEREVAVMVGGIVGSLGR